VRDWRSDRGSAKPPSLPVRRMSPAEMRELKEQLEMLTEMLEMLTE